MRAIRAIPSLSRYLIALWVLTGVLWGGCAGTQLGGFNLMSVQEEWELGNQLSQDIARKSPMVTDSESVAYINQLGQRLVQQTELRNLPWKFHIVRGQEVNAFNIPGGHVYVYTGLIEKASTESELAGVIGHEIGHGVARHATQQITTRYGLSLLSSLLLGQNPAVYQQILAQILGAGYLAKHGRDAEREADHLGVQYLYQAGIDPQGMVTFFQKLLQEDQRQPGRVSQFFASHPLTQERIQNVSAEIQPLGSRRNLIVSRPQFFAFKSDLVGRR
ncbi:MAG: M48 family metalloprotease [Candidatus Tectomicrobia bacterium]|uniref:M48 family metalloprotease n=1 Tax=Tectimicrobiota bacterium TaxID=2528274 RepID=A0A932G006_UNCTE|nr:M48 family metalloprotease [Candidatus Tectomicrobia bacterium]